MFAYIKIITDKNNLELQLDFIQSLPKTLQGLQDFSKLNPNTLRRGTKCPKKSAM